MTDLSGFRIGTRSGRNKHAIRWYDAQGLIPGVQRDAAGQRRFNSRHVQWLDFVDRLRSTGMTIAQIRTYTQLIQHGPSNLPRQRDLLAAHRQQVAATVAAWRDSLALIDAKLAFYDLWMSTGKRPDNEPSPSRNASTPAPKPAAPRSRSGHSAR
jgi:DNA-binding transcriptional MerR regulator